MMYKRVFDPSIIATPGRFMHVVVEMNLKLKSIQYVVFDEADRWVHTSLFQCRFIVCIISLRVLSVIGRTLREITIVFSSPEHEVLSELLWSFNVRRPSSVRACVRACVRPSTISLNYISSETTYWILTKLHRNDPWVVLYQSCSNRSSWLHK